MSDLIIKNDRDPKSKYRKLLDVIPTGEENAVSMSDLSRLLGLSLRNVRQLVQDARISGNIIAGSNSGYYIPQDFDELRRYFRSSMSRIKTNSRSLNAVRSKLKEENILEYEENIFPE